MSSKINFGVSEKKTAELQDRMKNCQLKEGDLEESFIKGSGPGGQKVNKTSSCVQLRHIPSGKIIKMQQERSLALNRFFARRKMCELLEIEQGIKTPEQSLSDKIRKQKQRRKRRGKNVCPATATGANEQ